MDRNPMHRKAVLTAAFPASAGAESAGCRELGIRRHVDVAETRLAATADCSPLAREKTAARRFSAASLRCEIPRLKKAGYDRKDTERPTYSARNRDAGGRMIWRDGPPPGVRRIRVHEPSKRM